MNRFRIKDTFELRSRNFFVLVGDISEGVIAVGMDVLIDRSHERTLKVMAVEFIDHISKKRADVGLCLSIEVVKSLGLDNTDAWGQEVICS